MPRRIREIIWPWSDNTLWGFAETLTLPRPREHAEIVAVVYAADALRVCLEEEANDRIGRDRVLFGHQPARSGHFDVPDTATFVMTVGLGAHGVMHIYEQARPRPNEAALACDGFGLPRSSRAG